MSHLLVCATPAPGHVNPMLTIATSLAERGHKITFLTAEPFRSRVEAVANTATGNHLTEEAKPGKAIRFVPLSGVANFDFARMDDFFPERTATPPGLALLAYDFKHIFGDTIPGQHRTIQNVLGTTNIDLILTDATFLGTAPLLLDHAKERPPVVSIGMMPLMLTSRDRPPVGPPSDDGTGRDYLEEHRAFQTSLQDVDEYLNCVLSDMNCQPLRHFFLDSMHSLPDRFLQLTGDRFEYPCSDLPLKIRFVGPLISRSMSNWVAPDWWPILDGKRPVVAVTQGTVSNTDLSELIEPTIQALANEDVTLVVSLGTHEKRTVNVPIPDNTIVAPFVPFEHLLPKSALFITNGGYGAVSQSLQLGVPMVVAGATEDKPFVAARVAWSGTGLDLGTNRPTTGQIYAAARRILTDNAFRKNAAVLSHSFEQYDALERIALEVEDAIASHEAVCELSQVTVA